MCKDIHLRIWAECIGLYEGLEVSEFEVAVILSCNGARVRLKFPADMANMDTLKKQLGSYKLGTKIGLLRTDEAFRSVIIRTITA